MATQTHTFHSYYFEFQSAHVFLSSHFFYIRCSGCVALSSRFAHVAVSKLFTLFTVLLYLWHTPRPTTHHPPGDRYSDTTGTHCGYRRIRTKSNQKLSFAQLLLAQTNHHPPTPFARNFFLSVPLCECVVCASTIIKSIH